MQRAQLGPPMVHMAKFDQNRLKDLGARMVDDRHTDRQTNAGNNKGNPSDRAKNSNIGTSKQQLEPRNSFLWALMHNTPGLSLQLNEEELLKWRQVTV